MSLIPLAILILKVLVLSLCALALGALVRNRSARSRSLVWRWVHAGLILLPITLVGTPTLQVTIGLWTSEPTTHDEVEDVEPVVSADFFSDQTSFEIGDDLTTSDGLLPVDDEAFVVSEETSSTMEISETTVLLGVWGMVSLLVLMPLIGALYRTRSLRKRSPRIDDELEGALRSISPVVRPQIYECSGVESPMTGGMIRPFIFLPPTWRSWSTERLDIVLRHELGHIQRHDWIFQMLSRAACALYWFLPPIWWLHRWAHLDRERACDELVVASGVSPSCYAAHLLSLAQSLSRRCSLATLPMATRTQLENRLMSLSQRTLARRNPAVSRRTPWWIPGSMTCLLVIGIVVLEPRGRAEASVEAPPMAAAPAPAGLVLDLVDESAIDDGASKHRRVKLVVRSADDKHGLRLEIQRGPDGRPVARAFHGRREIPVAGRARDMLRRVTRMLSDSQSSGDQSSGDSKSTFDRTTKLFDALLSDPNTKDPRNPLLTDDSAGRCDDREAHDAFDALLGAPDDQRKTHDPRRTDDLFDSLLDPSLARDELESLEALGYVQSTPETGKRSDSSSLFDSIVQDPAAVRDDLDAFDALNDYVTDDPSENSGNPLASLFDDYGTVRDDQAALDLFNDFLATDDIAHPGRALDPSVHDQGVFRDRLSAFNDLLAADDGVASSDFRDALDLLASDFSGVYNDVSTADVFSDSLADDGTADPRNPFDALTQDPAAVRDDSAALDAFNDVLGALPGNKRPGKKRDLRNPFDGFKNQAAKDPHAGRSDSTDNPFADLLGTRDPRPADTRPSLRLNGKATIDEGSIKLESPGTFVEVRNKRNGKDHVLQIRQHEDGRDEYRYWVAGEERPYDGAAKRWLRDMLSYEDRAKKAKRAEKAKRDWDFDKDLIVAQIHGEAKIGEPCELGIEPTRGSSIVVRSRANGKKRLLVWKKTRDGKMSYEWSVDGRRREFDQEAIDLIRQLTKGVHMVGIIKGKITQRVPF